MQAKKLNIPPVYLPGAAGNILNCGITSLAGPVGYTQTQPFLLVTHIRLLNTDAATPHVCSVYKGATAGSAGGTQIFGNTSVPAGLWVDWYGELRLDSADFLTGIADAASKVVILIDGEQGIA